MTASVGRVLSGARLAVRCVARRAGHCVQWGLHCSTSYPWILARALSPARMCAATCLVTPAGSLAASGVSLSPTYVVPTGVVSLTTTLLSKSSPG
jgi:hypothetical protein